MVKLSTIATPISKKIFTSNTFNEKKVNSGDSFTINNHRATFTTTNANVLQTDCLDHTETCHPLLFHSNKGDSLEKSIISSPTGITEHEKDRNTCMIYEKNVTLPSLIHHNKHQKIKDDDEDKNCRCNHNSDESLLTKKFDTYKIGDNYVNTNEFLEKNGGLNRSKNNNNLIGERIGTFINCNQNDGNEQSFTEEKYISEHLDKHTINNQGMALTSGWRSEEHNIVTNLALKNYKIKKKKMEEEERSATNSGNSNKSSSYDSNRILSILSKPKNKSEGRELLQDEEDDEEKEKEESDSRPQIVKQETRDTSIDGTKLNYCGTWGGTASNTIMEDEQERWNVSLAGNDDNGKLTSSKTHESTSQNKQDDTNANTIASLSLPYLPIINSSTVSNTNNSLISDNSGLLEFKRKPLAEVLLWRQDEQHQEQKSPLHQVTYEDSKIKPWDEQQHQQRLLDDVTSFDYDKWQTHHPRHNNQVPSTIEDSRGVMHTIHQDLQQNVYQQGFSNSTTPQTIQEYQPYQHSLSQQQQHYIQSSTPNTSMSPSPVSPSPHNLNRTTASSPSSPRAFYSSTHSFASGSGSGAGSSSQQQSPRFFHSQQYASSGSNSRSTTPHRKYGQGSNIPASPPESKKREVSSSNPSTPPKNASSLSSNRSAPDILKTLLRKKACLYEPETSPAIALITWLVGRHLALLHGYFSRQQLQAGVHHVVQNNIASGVITRTKVNRCMQIILNCCFHYIIPRPDGVEDSGKFFRKKFQSYAIDDSYRISNLPYPWDDIDVNALLQFWDSHNTTTTSSSTKDDIEQQPGKRTVLLCFNENVKSSDDVFRCHKDFIRDAANSANLHLTANEWKQFFFGDTVSGTITTHIGHQLEDTGSCTSSTTTTTSPTCYSPSSPIFNTSPLHAGISAQSASSSPLSLPMSSWQYHQYHQQQSLSPSPIAAHSKDNLESTNPSTSIGLSDYFGRMTNKELCDFRTSWCAKRYDHDPSLCGFAHTEINRGWLRRNPSVFTYVDKLCDNIIPINLSNANDNATATAIIKEKYYINACPFGKLCSFAHSQEEIDYHPNQYKTKICSFAGTHATTTANRPAWKSSMSIPRNIMKGCQLKDICPNYHPYHHSSSQQQQLHHHHYQEARQHQQSHSRFSHNHYHHHHQQHHNYGDFHSSTSSSPQQRHLHHNHHHNYHQALPKPLPISPMMYILPSPVSDFEKSLSLPGLRTLFRQRSSTMYSFLCSSSNKNDIAEQQQQKEAIIPYNIW